MFWVDSWAAAWLNTYVGHSWTLDTFCVLVASNFLFKGVWLVVLYPWLWFSIQDGKDSTRQALMVYGLVASIAAVLMARTIAALVPYVERPIHNPLLHLKLADGLSSLTLLHWTSFPSDHAALFTTLAVALIFVSRPVGVLALGYVLVFISLPRVYLGIHYPTDVITGTLLGVGVAWLGKIRALRDMIAGPSLELRDRHPGAFYAGFVLLLYLIGTVFGEVPAILRFAATVTVNILHRLGG